MEILAGFYANRQRPRHQPYDEAAATWHAGEKRGLERSAGIGEARTAAAGSDLLGA